MKNLKTSNGIVRQLLLLALILSTPIFSLQAFAQITPSIVDDGQVKILGKSNIHDWEMTSKVVESNGNFTYDKEGALQSVSAFSFSLATKSLKSGKSSMDSRTYKTLNADQYPKISYKLLSATISFISKNKYLIKSTGALTISGVTQTIAMNVTATVNPDKSINLSGSENLLLTDYKIQPPSFLLGAMKVGNELTIEFDLIYKHAITIALK